MPKGKKSFWYNGIEFDSEEEIEFQKFLEECEKYDLVDYHKYQPDTYTIAPKAYRTVTKRFKTKPDRKEQKHLFHPHVYTPDWEVCFTPKFFDCFPGHKLLIEDTDTSEAAEPDFRGRGRCLVDIKGAWNMHGGERIFPIHQKLMWSLHKRLVNKIFPREFFRRLSVVPDGVKWMKNRKQKTSKRAYQFVETFEDKHANKAL